MLLHINRIDYCEAYHLASAVIVPENYSVIISEPMPWQRLNMVGLATLETSEEVGNGVRKHTAKLTATLCGDRLNLPARPLAYRLTCANGRQYLLGTADPPFPLTTQEDKRPGNAAETSAVSLVITINNRYGLLYLHPHIPF